MRFFALPDSNTSQRVTISVLGHVVVSQMGIVQVPYATVTSKYFRALSIGQVYNNSNKGSIGSVYLMAIKVVLARST